MITIAIIVLIIVLVNRKAKADRAGYKPFAGKTAEAAGKRGEWLVSQELGGTKEGIQYVVNDILFKTENGGTCQIDHVFINNNGIWVIETKNYSGLICGEENWREWTQVLSGGKEKNKFYNPVKQNAVHVHNLTKCLRAQGFVLGAVVFTQKADLSQVKASGVYRLSEVALIKKAKTGIELSADKMKKYYKELLCLKNNSNVKLSEHVERIKRKQRLLEQGFCPRCGGKLVLREGKNGKFYGCANYPECTFVTHC